MSYWYRFIKPNLSIYRQHRQASVLKRLVSNKEDKIWNAAIWQEEGEIKKLLEEFEEIFYLDSEAGIRHDMLGVEGGVQRGVEGYVKPDIARAVAKDYDLSDRKYTDTLQNISSLDRIESHMKDIRDQLANTSRQPTQKEIRQFQRFFDGDEGVFSILWVCIYRNHASDVDYLLGNTNIDLRTQNGFFQRTVLHGAVSIRNQRFVDSILETNSSASPLGCIEVGNIYSETPLHTLITIYVKCKPQENPEESHMVLGMVKSLLEHGANVDALNYAFQTPLHLLVGSSNYDLDIIPLLQEFLLNGAEVNSKDIFGRSPLHLACEKQDHQAILLLVKEGADLEALDSDGRTPRAYLETSDHNGTFSRDLEILARTGFSTHEKPFKLPPRDGKISKRQMQICKKSPVYCRFQRNTKFTDKENHLFWNWVGTDQYVSDVLYLNSSRRGVTFLDDCEIKAASVWEDIQSQLEIMPVSRRGATHEDTQVDDDTWRWVNFPATNDFILDHVDELTSPGAKRAIWEFFQDNIKVRDAKESRSRIRAAHAKKMGNHGPNAHSEDSSIMSQAGSMVSIVIPFLDIEATASHLQHTTCGEDAYFPLTRIGGVQMPQTLDQTFNNTEGLTGLRSKENQVIYRWSEKQAAARRDKISEKHEPLEAPRTSSGSRFKYWPRNRLREGPDPRTASSDYVGDIFKGEGTGNATRMRSIQQEVRPRWLMVRQLWLWKLHDGTILTAIPSRENMCMADDLLETIRHSELNEVSTADDLMKHIVQQTVTFTERFRLAGLGEHILDIFENELASEMDREAGFFNSFTRKDWNSEYVNKAISEAAGCTWRVKDIRGELRLVDKVFTQQLDVLKEFATVIATDKGMSFDKQEAALVRESGLVALRERIKRIDEDAATTIDGLSNITQAMLAQASLKEAESARLMNFIILPFTVVTVVFTPLSFMTSLFAVNSDGFPHNDEGELRIPSNWLRTKMIIGEFGTLIPLLIIVVSISYLRTGTRRTPKEQPRH
ncbi:unnamed protein product [Fusarium venenatum]|uniref:Uncharacterized protein n=1 Tax=Fusarium venenatum TaxID=56646 RepID=A0A2L2T7A1_9HYPO|nr:uncharacterized protein FVRRES_00195 [Fusarium venenatum]CEI63683.1 unnamed protein product [Fusarium venenatum]